MLETQWSWVKCLPLALLRIRTQPRTDLGVSPYEMLFGQPYLATQHEIDIKECGNSDVQKYVQVIARNLIELRERGFIPQSAPLDFSLHKIKPGDWVLVKNWKDKSLTPSWEGPFQTQITTETAVRTLEKGWTHVNRVKGPVPPPGDKKDQHPEQPPGDRSSA